MERVDVLSSRAATSAMIPDGRCCMAGAKRWFRRNKGVSHSLIFFVLLFRSGYISVGYTPSPCGGDVLSSGLSRRRLLLRSISLMY